MSIKGKLGRFLAIIVLWVLLFQLQELRKSYDKKLEIKLSEKFNTTKIVNQLRKNESEPLFEPEPEPEPTIPASTTMSTTSTTTEEELSFEKEELSDQEYSMEEEKRIFWDGSNSPIASRFRERRHLMETGCSSMTPLDLVLSWRPKPWFLVAENPGIIGCAPPRTASHEWIHMFRQLDKLPEANSTEEQKEVEEFVDHIPHQEGDSLLVSSAVTRFIVVRHPFGRLHAIWFSIFRNDNQEGKELFEKYSMSRYVRSDPDEGYFINFYDLCQFVSEDSQARTNPLFKPLTALCDPCSNPFDFVAKFETLTEDANWLLQRADSVLVFPSITENYDIWKNDWKKLEKKNSQVAQKLHQLYYWDFRLFGYDGT